MAECPKCQGRMEEGAPYVDMWGWRMLVRWVDGRPRKSSWSGLSFDGRERSDISSLRCDTCGFIELYAGNGAGADYGTMHLRAENERLKLEMARVMDRVKTLERIATDPAERTAREIEDLRDKDR
ncbi:hypothetical protein [Aurantiacibacter spongiae]|uniref:Uncharacterized protein n=1 Tax=Aurantiacibacter spongiae TaxID=2488860 RepID=A0A3N5CY43_9SPHN|nr:hypothetical protein [Aurantiacibacter spongiae]RPF72570.1 hypothetical protein EG799_13740 [Aurantiacibacter spongiae]